MMNPDDHFRFTRAEIEHILKCLGDIDEARKALAAKGPGNEAIIDELEKSTIGVYYIIGERTAED